jgi:hypothetical protein
MESINKMAVAAAQAVWGDDTKKEEPVSGKTGDVSKGEPYDAGNLGGKEVENISHDDSQYRANTILV